MKEVLKVMKFDFLTAKPLALRAYILLCAVCCALSLFFSPIISSYIFFAAMIFVIPLQSVADRCGFNKLYGTLPVNRKNITRARFLYIFLVHFIAELIAGTVAIFSYFFKLYRILPNQEGTAVQFIKNSFYDTKLVFVVAMCFFAFFGLMFSYMEMMGQLFGRENEMKIIVITLGALGALIILISQLFNRGLIPPIILPDIPESFGGRALVALAVNVIMLGICMLFGEITAGRLAKREL